MQWLACNARNARNALRQTSVRCNGAAARPWSFRSISLTGAIERGIRSAQKDAERKTRPISRPRGNDGDDRASQPDPDSMFTPTAHHRTWADRTPHNPTTRHTRAGDPVENDDAESESNSWSVRSRGWSNRPRLSKDGRREDRPESVRAWDRESRPQFAAPPEGSVPYTTAGSEFLYGSNSVLAALQARRRRFYKLYRHKESSETASHPEEQQQQILVSRETPNRKERREAWKINDDIRLLASELGIEVVNTKGHRWNRALLQMTDGRPHNGLVLESSPIPRLPVVSLGTVYSADDPVTVKTAWQSQEQADVNSSFTVSGNKASLPSTRPPRRYPFVLFFDRITDTGNFGAIIRSAWFLGVDAVIIPEHGTAPISPVTLKSSSGALEYMPILQVKDEVTFVQESRANGWKFFGAAAPEASSPRGGKDIVTSAGETLLRHPCVLVLGNEETGIRWQVFRHRLDGVVGVPNARPGIGNVDSLNVSVAAAILTQRFFDGAAVIQELASPDATATAPTPSLPETNPDPPQSTQSNE